MASTNCWRCLARPSQRLLAPVIAVASVSASASVSAAFSTSALHLAKASEISSSKHIRAGKKFAMGKKRRGNEKIKSPLPGERKAFRKRIQLSNDNAIRVAGLDTLSAENVVNPETAGKIVGIPAEVVDQLRACEAFKPSQNWSLFHGPHFLVRQETVDMAREMVDAVEAKKTLRLAVTGGRGSGKSILGLQALATGFLNNWVVINLPEGQELTTAVTEYAPAPNSELFAQPVYIVKLMQTIYQTNQSVLSQHKVELDHIHLPISVTRTMTLAALVNATKEPDFAWPVFQAFWRELLLPGRPPILFALDGLPHIMRVSEYRTPAFELIHSHDLGLVRMFTDALGGKTEFVNGAAIVGVTTKGNAPILPSMDKALAQASAQQKGEEVPPRDPFFRKYDERVFDALRGVKVLELQGVSKAGARALMEYWAASGIVRSRIDEKHVSEKWTLAGGGVIAEMERVTFHDLRAAT